MIASLPDERTMYNALLKKDSHYDGIFFVGVKTTGIFCRPTCTARKPMQKNVEFAKNVSDAQSGCLIQMYIALREGNRDSFLIEC